jgi:hypothetical protein
MPDSAAPIKGPRRLPPAFENNHAIAAMWMSAVCGKIIMPAAASAMP